MTDSTADTATDEGTPPPARRLAPGDPAPDFALPDADGRTVSLPQFRGGRVVLYFYPKADTPGCTTQACDFRDNLQDFEQAGTTVIGISPDETPALASFRDKYGLTFPLLSDPTHAVLETYGAWGEKKMYGRTTTGVIRTTIVVDGHGRVEKASYGVKATGHVERLQRDLGITA